MKAYLLILCSCFLTLAACSKQEKKHDGLIYCSEGSPTSFNPQLDTSGTTIDATAHQLYDRLLEFDPVTGRIKPGLATSWLVSDDGLVYTFQLRKKVQFHHTDYFQPARYFNANDVLFSLNRWRQPQHPYHEVSGGIYPYFVSLGLDSIIHDVKRINGYRVEIHLSRPDSSFLANLATDFAVILSAEYAQQLLDKGTPQHIDQYPIGTGPFKFFQYRQNSYIRYQEHNNYWRDIPLVKQLIYDITPSSSMRIAKLITGECDAIAFPAHSELDVIRRQEELVLDVKPGLNVGFWAFNTIKPPFDDPRVRKALAMAVDTDTLLNAVYFDSAIEAKSILPPTSWAYDPTTSPPRYNPVLARQLLSEAGIEPGFSMNIWAMPVERAYNPNARKMAELIQNYLSQIGIRVNIVSYGWSTFRKKLQEGLHDSVLIGWSADNGDPDNFFRPLLSCASIFSGTNRSNWCHEEYDDLIAEAIAHTDEDIRKEYYSQANAIINKELPLLPIAHAYRYQAYRRNLKGLVISPLGGIHFAGVEKNQ